MSIPNPTTNQRQWENKAHTTHDKDQHNKAEKTKEMSTLNPTTNQRDNGNIRHTQDTGQRQTQQSTET